MLNIFFLYKLSQNVRFYVRSIRNAGTCNFKKNQYALSHPDCLTSPHNIQYGTVFTPQLPGTDQINTKYTAVFNLWYCKFLE